MSVTRWEQGSLLSQSNGGRDVVDGWATQVQAVAHLASIIAPTDFCKQFKGSDAAVTAAILAGREIGIGPMASLQHLFVVEGRVGMSAQLMRALVFAHGHTIRVVDLNTQRCALVGRRRGDAADSPEVPWTIGDARTAGLLGRPMWQKYPRAMLLARATGELCRALFPDVIGGMRYTTEELQDMDGAEATEAPEAAPPTRKVRRAGITAKRATPYPRQQDSAASPAVAEEAPPAVVPPPHMAAGEAPPLPEDAPTPAQNPTESAEQADPEAQAPDDMTGPQRAHLHVLLNAAGVNEPRDVRMRVLQGLAGRRLVSSNQLTRTDASRIIDALIMAESMDEPGALSALVEAGWEAIADREQPALWEDDLADDEGTDNA